MGIFLDPSDVPSIGVADADTLIDDAEALALLAAPCLSDEDLPEMKIKATRAILRGTVLRWATAGDGVSSQLTAGPFSQTLTPQVRRNSFWPSEIKDLQLVCKEGGGAYSLDMTGLSTSTTPLAGAVINTSPGQEPLGQWSPETL